MGSEMCIRDRLQTRVQNILNERALDPETDEQVTVAESRGKAYGRALVGGLVQSIESDPRIAPYLGILGLGGITENVVSGNFQAARDVLDAVEGRRDAVTLREVNKMAIINNKTASKVKEKP